jgi:hypothetical protein
MTFASALKNFDSAVKDAADRKGDYLEFLDYAADEVLQYLKLRGADQNLQSAVSDAAEQAQEESGDYIGQLDEVLAQLYAYDAGVKH